MTFWKATKESLLYSILHKNPDNIKTFIKKSENPNNPWKSIYIGLLNKLKRKEELYKAPNLNHEIDYYLTEERDI